eukprot:SAG31_NODE_2691_length_5240_cov_1.866174_1_plen_369_part_00
MPDQRLLGGAGVLLAAVLGLTVLWLRKQKRTLAGGASAIQVHMSEASFCGCTLIRAVEQKSHFAASAGQESAFVGAAGRTRRRVLLICNPASGSSPAQRAQRARALQEGEEAARAAGLAIERAQTLRPQHAIEIAQNIDLEGVDALCVAGGDGTLREVVQGMLQRSDGAAKRVPVVPIPTGTSNNYARDLGLDSPIAAFEAVASNRGRPVDAVLVSAGEAGNATCSINVVCWGLTYDAATTAESLRAFGSFRYDIAGFWHIMKNKRRAAEVRLQAAEGAPWAEAAGDFALGMLQNTRCSGRAFAFAPNAQLDDGLFDLILLEREHGRMCQVSVTDSFVRVSFAACGQCSIFVTAHNPLARSHRSNFST